MKKLITVLLTAMLLIANTAYATGTLDDVKKAVNNSDYEQAISLLKPLALKGDVKGGVNAQTLLGIMYSAGQGVVQDYVEAVKWWKLAAAQGDTLAQFNLGDSYENGQGIEQDYAEAVKWYKLAAAKGYSDAQNSLGNMYYLGKGVVQDYVEAVKWWKLAAAQGDVGAQTNLGFMYEDGQGVVQDYVMAHMWLNLAAIKGDKNPVDNRVRVANKMTQPQIAKAQKLARECLARKYKGC